MKNLEDKLAALISLAFDAHQQAAKLGVDEETARRIFEAYALLVAAGLDEQGNKRTFN